MIRTFRKPSPAMLIAMLALFVAAGGPAYAAKTINGKVLKNRSIAGSKIKRNTLTGRQIRESTLGKVPSAIAADSAKSASTANVASAVSDGAIGASKLGSLFVVKATSVDVPDGNAGSIDAFCPAGARAIAGGGRSDFLSGEGLLGSSRPQKSTANDALETNDGFIGWRVSATNPPGGAPTINPDVWVVCLR